MWPYCQHQLCEVFTLSMRSSHCQHQLCEVLTLSTRSSHCQHQLCEVLTLSTRSSHCQHQLCEVLTLSMRSSHCQHQLCEVLALSIRSSHLLPTSALWGPHNNHHLRPFFRDHPCETVPEENFWNFWCKGRLTEADTNHPAGRLSIQTNQCPPPPSPHIFNRPDALPAAQPTVSKH